MFVTNKNYFKVELLGNTIQTCTKYLFFLFKYNKSFTLVGKKLLGKLYHVSGFFETKVFQFRKGNVEKGKEYEENKLGGGDRFSVLLFRFLKEKLINLGFCFSSFYLILFSFTRQLSQCLLSVPFRFRFSVPTEPEG